MLTKLIVVLFTLLLLGCGGGSGGSDSPADDISQDETEVTPTPIITPTPVVTPTPAPIVEATRTLAFSIDESSEIQTVLSLFESNTQIISTQTDSGSSLYTYKNNKESEYRFNNAGELIAIYSDGQQAIVSTELDHYLITFDDRYSLLGAGYSKQIEIPFSDINTRKVQLTRTTNDSCLSGDSEDFNDCISTRITTLRQKVASILVTPWYLPLLDIIGNQDDNFDLELQDEEELTEIENEVEASTSFVSQATFVIDDDLELPTENVFTELKETVVAQLYDIYTNLVNGRSDIGDAYSPIDVANIYSDGDIQQSIEDVFDAPISGDDDPTTPPQISRDEYIISGDIDLILQFPLRETVDYYYQKTFEINVLGDEDANIESITSVSDEAQEIDLVALALATISNDKKKILFTMGSHRNKVHNFFRKNIIVSYKTKLANGDITENSLNIEFSATSVSLKERTADGINVSLYNKYTGFSTVTDSMGTDRVVLDGSFESIYSNDDGVIGVSYFQTYVDGIAEGPGWSRNFNYVSENVYEPISCQYTSTFSMSNNALSGTVINYYSDNETVPEEKRCTVF